MKGFVDLVSGGNAIQDGWVSSSRDDECMDNEM